MPAEQLGGLESDLPARGWTMEQDREIAGKSGCPPLKIERIESTGTRKKKTSQERAPARTNKS